MKTKHTPGNWQTMNSHKPGFIDIVSLGDDQPQNRKWICEIGPSDTTEEDASLIASAPELLSALQELVRLVDNGSIKGVQEFGKTFDIMDCLAVNDARAAISKAIAE